MNRTWGIFIFGVISAFLGACGGGDGGGQSTPNLSISDQSGFEPVTGTGTITLAVTLSAASTQTVTVGYATADGTATAASDYTTASGTLTFAAGETRKTLTVTVLADTPFDESDESVTVTLSSPSGATLARSQATATIVDKVVNPDTGIVTCANANSNTLTCPQSGFEGQDADSGRDNTHNDNSDGRAGFSYTKLDSDGNDLAANAVSWSCVRDEVTGLVWEIKTDDGGLRDRDHTYAWYNPDSATNGGNAGVQTGGSCTGSGISCNTAAYVTAVNAAGLCGANDWRMPTTEELLSINDYGATTPPAIDTAYFNDLVISSSLTFWALETSVSNTADAWVVDYAIGGAGNSSVGSKASLPSLVRLVRKP
jgi:hypothetical protein